MKRIIDKLMNEPVLVVNLVNGLIGLAIAFGADFLSEERRAAIIGVVTLFMNILARQMVTPNRKL